MWLKSSGQFVVSFLWFIRVYTMEKGGWFVLFNILLKFITKLDGQLLRSQFQLHQNVTVGGF